ncbi:hypothetical protein HUG15_02635 [Salicibibacter cibarius]|uniref:Uncharacterized protein n=1 Tax=Salicibibacter cibarius TaxID=2743000 RepID=A0A7T6Z0C7_9BACI|nr:hypothetical protein HUG15_02635 [Salicibibacter cibarius]
MERCSERSFALIDGNDSLAQGVAFILAFEESQKIELPEDISLDFFDVLERNTKKHDETLRGLVDR